MQLSFTIYKPIPIQLCSTWYETIWKYLKMQIVFDIVLTWSWSLGSWIYNNLCNQCLSPLMLWVRISIRARCTTLCDKVHQWLATGRWVSLCPPVSSCMCIIRIWHVSIIISKKLMVSEKNIFRYTQSKCINCSWKPFCSVSSGFLHQ
jgi:hypothetical protein